MLHKIVLDFVWYTFLQYAAGYEASNVQQFHSLSPSFLLQNFNSEFIYTVSWKRKPFDVW